MNASNEYLRLTDIALLRGGRMLFGELSLELNSGEALSLMGPNGAGKSSLLHLMAGLVMPTLGEVDAPDSIGLLSSRPALKLEQRVADELRFWARIDGADLADVRNAAHIMGLDPLFDLKCGMLSDGQARRVAIARLIAGGFHLWLLDEPTNALDARTEAILFDIIRKHLGDGGMVVIATHRPLPIESTILRL